MKRPGVDNGGFWAFVERQLRGLSAKGAGVSAVLLLFVGFFGGFLFSKSIYQDQANHWRELYNTAQTRRGLSDKDLKNQALDAADKLDGLLRREREASRITVATHNTINALGFSTECSTRRSDAKILRDELLHRIPTIYRDSSATNAYEDSDCIRSLETVSNDLRAMARKLPD